MWATRNDRESGIHEQLMGENRVHAVRDGQTGSALSLANCACLVEVTGSGVGGGWGGGL